MKKAALIMAAVLAISVSCSRIAVAPPVDGPGDGKDSPSQSDDPGSNPSRDPSHDNSGDPSEDIVLPPEPESGYAVYALNRSDWSPLFLYLYGEVNDLIGKWPGIPFTERVYLGPWRYERFDLPESIRGYEEYVEFNNIESKHSRENRPLVRFGDQKVFWYLVDNEKAVELEDPLNPGIDPPGGGGGDDGDGGGDDDGGDSGDDGGGEDDDADDVDWPAAVSYVFDSTVIPEIHVSISAAQWQKLLDMYDRNPDNNEYVSCDVRYLKGSESWEIGNAAIRLRGNTSRRRPEEGGWLRHVHFGLNLHKNVHDAAHTIKGLRKVDLKWFKDDPMYVREVFCYDLFARQGVWTAVRDIYVRLWVKAGDRQEAYYGVYGMLEHIDKNYLRTRKDKFGSKGGNLWKCRWGASLADVNADMGVDDNVNIHTYELKTNTTNGFGAAKSQLQDFISNLSRLSGDSFNQWISSVMDVDLLLKTYAVNVAVGMWDDYWNNTNNYYLYFNSTDTRNYKVFFIPYDYDNTLGTSQDCGVQSDAGRHSPFNWGSSSNPLMVKILQNPEWKLTYTRYLQDIVRGDMSYENSVARIKEWQGRIGPYIDNDTGQDTYIHDEPAPWGNHHEYRLLTPGNNNFFQVKASSVL